MIKTYRLRASKEGQAVECKGVRYDGTNWQELCEFVEYPLTMNAVFKPGITAWGKFLEARRDAIVYFRKEGKSWNEIVLTLNLHDRDQAKRIYEAVKEVL